MLEGVEKYLVVDTTLFQHAQAPASSSWSVSSTFISLALCWNLRTGEHCCSWEFWSLGLDR